MNRPSIVDYWSKAAEAWDNDYHKKWPLVHPDDEQLPTGDKITDYAHNSVSSTFDKESLIEFVARAGTDDKKDKGLKKKLELGLLPQPYCGNLSTAKIFIVMLNPGLDLADYYGELEVPALRQRLLKNLQQDFGDTEFPFMWLDPALCWHGGFRWWEGKFSAVIRKLREKGKSRLEAMKLIAQNVASLELSPYHSKSAPPNSVFRFESPKTMKQFIDEDLLPSARRGEKLVILARRAREYASGADRTNIICFCGSKARRAHFEGKDSKKIAKRLHALASSK